MNLAPHQQEAIEKAYDLLKEHFESNVIVVSIDVNDQKQSIYAYWAGGFANAIGLLRLAEKQIDNINQREP